MRRLFIHVEGQTEISFVTEILRDHLVARGFHSVAPRLLGNARPTRQRGGICSWSAARLDIVNHLKSDAGCIATTMVDYYGLPETGGRAWPGRATAPNLKFDERASHVESALLHDVAKEIGNPSRFIPFVVMHEFESLLFSDCDALSGAVGRPELSVQFESIRRQFATPEEINDSVKTKPSKRIESLVPGYQKPLMGLRAARSIGLDRIRAECPHFDHWLSRLESIVSGPEIR